MRRRAASLDPRRPATVLHEGPAWVVEACWLAGGAEPVVAKRARRPGFHARTLLRAELDVARSADHDRLVRAVGLVDLGGDVALCLTPRCRGPLATEAPAPLPPDAVAGVVGDVLGALAALHAAGWAHGRVDAGHVLVGPDGRAVLAGLGGARRVEPAGSAPATGRRGGSHPDPADDVAAVAELGLACLEPTGTDPEAVGLRSVLGRMADPTASARPTAATAADLVARFGPSPRPLPEHTVVPGTGPDDQAARGDTAGSGATAPNRGGAPEANGCGTTGPTRSGTGGSSAPATVDRRTSGVGVPPRPGHRGGRRHRSRAPSGATVPCRRRWLPTGVLALAAAACLALGIRLLGAPDGAPTTTAAPPCPLAGAPAAPGAEVAVVDVDARGCSVAVRRLPGTGHLEVVSPEGIRRYALGDPGDRVVLGDWDCDGAATPLLVPSGSSTGWRYDRWPEGDRTVAGVPVELDRPGGAPPPPTCDGGG